MKISGMIAPLLKRGFQPLKAVEIMADAGYDCIDYSLFGEKSINDAYIQAKELNAYAESRGIYFNQSHAPFPASGLGYDDDQYKYELVIKAIETASMLGVRNIVVHPNKHLEYKYNYDVLKEKNYKLYSKLLPYAEKYDINIAIENMWNYIPGTNKTTYNVCSHPDEFCEYIDMMNSERFVACFDVGHCSLVDEDIPNFIKTLGKKRLQALHIHDTDFLSDLHTLPGWGKINFDGVMKALSEIGYEGELTHEADAFLSGCENDFIPIAVKFMAARMRYFADKYFKY